MGENETTGTPAGHRAGLVAILGRPNMGKSTLMNAVLGVKLSIVTDKPQTTRNRIRGVHTVEGRGQIVFVDTPGIHDARGHLNRRMVGAAWSALEGTHAVCVVVDASSLDAARERLWHPIDAEILAKCEAAGLPVVMVLNKVDRVQPRAALMPVLERIGREHTFAAVIPTSATRGTNVGAVVDELLNVLPEAPPLFAGDDLTDRGERFFVSEIIREQVLRQTHQEVPYGVAVEVEEFVEALDEGRIRISAILHVERDSQKGILIGRAGSRLKEIGTSARAEIERFLSRRVHLDLLVRVEPEWASRDPSLDRLGYSDEGI